MTLIEEMVAEATKNNAPYLSAGRLLMEGAKKIWDQERRIEELEERLAEMQELESEPEAMRGGEGDGPEPEDATQRR